MVHFDWGIGMGLAPLVAGFGHMQSGAIEIGILPASVAQTGDQPHEQSCYSL
jgi:hypothetical protein